MWPSSPSSNHQRLPRQNTRKRFADSRAAVLAWKSRPTGLVSERRAHGFRVVDVWQSEEMFQRFGERLMPILKAVGVEGQPEVYPAHTLVSA